MRPVSRGPAPRAYSSYADALEDLVAVLGDFCSYCERQIETHLAVEHVQPKSRMKTLRNEWSNLLLGCVNCNSCKGKKAVKLDNCLWPDRDNTLRAFVYLSDGTVCTNTRLRQTNRLRAMRTLRLVGLDKVPDHSNPKRRPTKQDLRWRRRQEAFDIAQRQKQRLMSNTGSVALRDAIADVAHGRGMFSIWLQVFADDPDMRTRLINRFVGTALDCFCSPGQTVVRRKGGRT